VDVEAFVRASLPCSLIGALRARARTKTRGLLVADDVRLAGVCSMRMLLCAALCCRYELVLGPHPGLLARLPSAPHVFGVHSYGLRSAWPSLHDRRHGTLMFPCAMQCAQ